MFKCVELPWLVQFFLMFYNDKPVDWLLDHVIFTKVCSPEKDHVRSLNISSLENYLQFVLVVYVSFGFHRNTARKPSQNCGYNINHHYFSILAHILLCVGRFKS